MPKKIELNTEVAEKFEITGKPVSSHFVSRKYGEINFKKMTAAQAERLVANSFPYLAAKSGSKKLPATDPKEGEKGK